MTHLCRCKTPAKSKNKIPTPIIIVAATRVNRTTFRAKNNNYCPIKMPSFLVAVGGTLYHSGSQLVVHRPLVVLSQVSRDARE